MDRPTGMGGQRISFLYRMLVPADIGVIVVSFIVAYLSAPTVRLLLIPGEFARMSPFHSYLIVLFTIMPLWLLLYDKNNLYHRVKERSAGALLAQCVIANITGLLILSFILYFGKIHFVSRLLIFLFAGLNTNALFWTRLTFKSMMLRSIPETLQEHVLIVGSRDRARHIVRCVEQVPGRFKVVGCLELDDGEVGKRIEGSNTEVVSTIDRLEEVLLRETVDRVIITIPVSSFPHFASVMASVEKMGVNVDIMPEQEIIQLVTGGTISKMRFGEFFGIPMLTLQSVEWEPGKLFVKRVIDLTFSSTLLLLLVPLFGIVAMCIKFTSGGPVFYRWRVRGFNGREFTSYKFRTMVENADCLKANLAEMNEMQGPVFKMKDDPRVTRLGRILRKYSIDELPQLYSVLKGDMSLVGPRPPLQSEVERFEFWHRRKLSIKPGITCLWQVDGRNTITDFHDWVRMDLEYIDNWSLGLDMKILLKTLPAILRGTGA